MIIHETSQNLPKNNPFLLGTVSLSLFSFSYLADKIVEFGLLALTIVGLKLLSTYFTRARSILKRYISMQALAP